MWPSGKIPYTYHWSIEEVNRSHLVEKAIQKIEEVSCLEFEDITAFMKTHLEDYQLFHYDRNYFIKFKKEPDQFPDFLL